MGIFDMFRKKEPVKTTKQVDLSKIDKHVGLILREKLASNNKTVTEILSSFDETKKGIIPLLRSLHKKTLMNPNIPQREIQLMEGNRDNYIKRIAHFITSIEVPKQYLDLYHYTIEYSKNMDTLSKDTQKNVFVLKEFFESELKDVNKQLNKLEEDMIKIRVLFEKHNIQRMEEITSDIDKIKKLDDRVHTITSGTDFRALEGFKADKDAADKEIKELFGEFDTLLSGIDTALKKYYYRNQDKKIVKSYLDAPYKTLLEDKSLELSVIARDISEHLDDMELKEKKREHVKQKLERLTFEYLNKLQTDLRKLEDTKKNMQTRITHNSASLNLSEQQYWIDANKDKIHNHKNMILKLEGDLGRFDEENKFLKDSIHEELERILGENIELIDDLEEE